MSSKAKRSFVYFAIVVPALGNLPLQGERAVNRESHVRLRTALCEPGQTWLGVQNFENNVLYHFPFVGDRLRIGRFCPIARGVKFIMNVAALERAAR